MATHFVSMFPTLGVETWKDSQSIKKLLPHFKPEA